METEESRTMAGGRVDDGRGETPVVALDNVEIVYDKHFLAVQGLSLEAHRGDIVALLGPNGAGKSTVLKMISGIGRSERGEVTRGHVHYDGVDVANARPKAMVSRGVTHVLEERRVFEDLTVEENLRCGLYRSGRRLGFDRDDYELAFEYFPDLEDKLDVNAGYASGGQQQMLVIARALLSLTETGEDDDSGVWEVTASVEGADGESATVTLDERETTTTTVDGLTVELRLDAENELTGTVRNDADEVLEDVTVVFDVDRPTAGRCTRDISVDGLGPDGTVAFDYDVSPARLLLLDEPSLGLAPQLVSDIFETLVEINREENITMLIADQNAKKTLGIADYGYVMENGQVELHDPADVLMDREEIKEYYLGTSKGGDRYQNIRHYKIRKRYD